MIKYSWLQNLFDRTCSCVIVPADTFVSATWTNHIPPWCCPPSSNSPTPGGKSLDLSRWLPGGGGGVEGAGTGKSKFIYIRMTVFTRTQEIEGWEKACRMKPCKICGTMARYWLKFVIDIHDKLLAFASNSPHTLLAGSLRNYNGDGNANATQ